ncbi:hypothetical protein LWI29_002022 [Acer saccharum]|uniref:Cytochrome P450 n=1 Tax=Acer saccharum TaxID=4024 RepID=A0AA39VDD2_ACESA|nr:hypothetical protein LWI29_002022 [Acer saccharum]
MCHTITYRKEKNKNMSHLCLTKDCYTYNIYPDSNERVNFPLFSPPSRTIGALRKTSKKLPPGSLGLPIIGESLSFLHALQTNIVFLHGQTANKLVYTCDGNALANQQPPSVRRICSEKNITELRGDEHKRVRDALVSFLKPEVLKQYVGKMDEEIRKHLEMHWQAKGHDSQQREIHLWSFRTYDGWVGVDTNKFTLHTVQP